MKKVLDKGVAVLICLITSVISFGPEATVIPFLTACIFSAAGEFVRVRAYYPAALAAMCLMTAALPAFTVMSAVLIADFSDYDYLALPFPAIAAAVSGFALISWLCLAAAIVACVYIGLTSGFFEKKLSELKRSRDLSEDEKRRFERINRGLSERAETEKQLAALEERNRIAGELHDKIGHTVTGALLQTGALMASCKDPVQSESLAALKDTLSRGMDDIRNSLRNIHEDVIDLESELDKIIRKFKGPKTEFSCSLNSVVNKDYARALIDTLKEALSNAAKYSDAKIIAVELKEFPGFYRFSVADDGKGAEKAAPGMGLSGMEERAKKLGGLFNADGSRGFKVTLTLFKKNGAEE